MGRSQTIAMAFALLFADLSAANAIVVGGNTSAQASASMNWAWDNPEHAELRTALENPANFGPGGLGGDEAVTTVDLLTIDAATLSGVDIFVSSWWREDQSAPVANEIVDWFLAGGDLLLLQDASNRDGISQLLGFTTIGGSQNPTTVAPGAIGNGPFGPVNPVSQAGSFGHFDNLTITNLGGVIDGVNDLGQATIVSFAAGVLGPSAGALVAMADVDLISGGFGGADFAPPNDKGKLALNTFAFLSASEVTAVPVPAALPLLASSLLALTVAGWRRRCR